MSAAQNSERVWFIPAVIAAAFIAGLGGYGCYSQAMQKGSIASFSDSAREELAALRVPARATTVVERQWVKEAPNEYLIAAHIPAPCQGVVNFVSPAERAAVTEALAASQDPDLGARTERLEAISDGAPGNLVVALIHGTQLIEAREFARAEQILKRTLDRTNKDELIIASAKASNHTLDLHNTEVSTLIHLQHACVVAGLLRLPANPLCVVPLRNVIGSVKPLSRRRLPGRTRDEPVWSRLPIPAPGCTGAGAQTLSTYDLYNNLVIAYMNEKLPVGEPWRTKEFGRLETDDGRGPLREFLKAQVKRASESNWKDEKQLGALSNVETVIDWVHPDVPDDARFDFNAVHVIDWWTKGEPGELSELRNKLIEQAFHQRNVLPAQQTSFARGVLRMLATSNIDRTRIAGDAAQVRAWLPPEDARLLDDLLTADTARADLPRWLVAPEEDQEPPYAKLGPRAADWYTAALYDFAAVAAEWVAPRSVDEQRHMIVALHRLLRSTTPPPQIEALEKQRNAWDRVWLRLYAMKWFCILGGAMLALFVWLALVWILVHIRERRLLRTSFYNLEYDLLSKGDSPGGTR